MKNVCLVVIDGFGLSDDLDGDATVVCSHINGLKNRYPFLKLHASGEWVGLPANFMGNSEVGHQTIGAGRTIDQSLIQINKLISSGNLEKILNSLPIKSNNVHLIGMVSDGGVHSHIDHINFLSNTLSKTRKVYVHGIADGIDVPKDTYMKYFSDIKNLASISGRYYAMDRDKNMERTNLYFNMLVGSDSIDSDSNLQEDNVIGKDIINNSNIFVEPKRIKDILEKIKNADGDEFILPTLLIGRKIKKSDTVIFCNFRADRMRQIYSKFKEYCQVFTLAEYENNDLNAIVKKPSISNGISEWVSKNGLTQAHIAETEKYAHVTYFFNGGKEQLNLNEDWILVPSPKVENFTFSPKMSMEEVVDKALCEINKKKNFVVLNLSAPDLVGHTGNFEKTKEACLCLDDLIKTLEEKCLSSDYALLITADHGNAEKMVIKGKVCKSHTTNKVPFIAINSDLRIKSIENPSLRDVAATVFKLLDIKNPKECEGTSLLE